MPSPVLDRDLNPYRGLSRYDEHDAEWFFGRDRLVAELVVRGVERPAGGRRAFRRRQVIAHQAGVLAALTAGRCRAARLGGER